MKKILIFTATYNEYENIVELIKKIKNQKSKPDLLIIDTRPMLYEYPVIPKFVWSYANPVFGLKFPVIQTNPDRIKISYEGTLYAP